MNDRFPLGFLLKYQSESRNGVLAAILLKICYSMFNRNRLFSGFKLVQSLSYSRIGHPELKSCPLCANRLKATPIGGKTRQACPSCEFVHWDNPKPVTATLVPMNGGIVLVKRKFEPYVDDWCLPGGFMEAAEHPEQSAQREVFEETGLEVEISRLLSAETPWSWHQRGDFVLFSEKSKG